MFTGTRNPVANGYDTLTLLISQECHTRRYLVCFHKHRVIMDTLTVYLRKGVALL